MREIKLNWELKWKGPSQLTMSRKSVINLLEQKGDVDISILSLTIPKAF